MTGPKAAGLRAKKNRVGSRGKSKKPFRDVKPRSFTDQRARRRKFSCPTQYLNREPVNRRLARRARLSFPAEGHAGNVYEVKVYKISRFVITYYRRSRCQIIVLFAALIKISFNFSRNHLLVECWTIFDYRLLPVEPDDSPFDHGIPRFAGASSTRVSSVVVHSACRVSTRPRIIARRNVSGSSYFRHFSDQWDDETLSFGTSPSCSYRTMTADSGTTTRDTNDKRPFESVKHISPLRSETVEGTVDN